MKTINKDNPLNILIKSLFFVYVIFSAPVVIANSGYIVEEMSILKGEHDRYLEAVKKMQDELYQDIASSLPADPLSIEDYSGEAGLKGSTL